VKKLNEESQQQQQHQQQQHGVVVVGTAPGGVSAAPPVVDDAMCQICHKTKFADGVGNQCHYCGLRSCSRCGAKAALRSDKVRLPNDKRLRCFCRNRSLLEFKFSVPLDTK